MGTGTDPLGKHQAGQGRKGCAAGTDDHSAAAADSIMFPGSRSPAETAVTLGSAREPVSLARYACFPSGASEGLARQDVWTSIPPRLLVLTQDGRVARQLIGEDSTVDKEYLVRVRGDWITEGRLLNYRAQP